MPLRAPMFWQNPPESPGWQARVLAPLGHIYGTLSARRLAAGQAARLVVPTICVGNLTAGGGGKTPTVIALLEELNRQGRKAHVVSKGYGGRATSPVLVDNKAMTASDAGDEPLLISQFGPCWVGPRRAATSQLAIDAGAEVIIYDDGYQDPSIPKDLALLVVDARRGFGNGYAIPAGPLRETVQAGLARADAAILIGTKADRSNFLRSPSIAVGDLDVIEAELHPLQTGMDWRGQRIFAFAGIAYPEKFFETLTRLGADIVRRVSLSDHAEISERLIERLLSEAQKYGAQLVTTEKDMMRLPSRYLPFVSPLPVRLGFENMDAFQNTISRGLKA